MSWDSRDSKCFITRYARARVTVVTKPGVPAVPTMDLSARVTG